MLTDIHRSSSRRCSLKKGVPKNFAKFTGKHLWQILRISSYSVQMWENTDLKNSKYGPFSRSVAVTLVIVTITIIRTVMIGKT